MSNIKVFNVLGKEVSSTDLEKSIFDVDFHKQSVFDVVLSDRAHARQGTHAVKTRAQVRGGGRKP